MQTNRTSLLDEVLLPGNYWTLYRFSNADGKEWALPVDNLAVSLNLYQPSGAKGKLLKRFLPALHRLRPVQRVLHISKSRYSLHPAISRCITEAFPHASNLSIALFGGTPCVHQKITMQISCGKRLLGYCKVTDNAEIGRLFAQEAEMLANLHANGIEGVPQPLMVKHNLGGKLHLFIQSTIKTSRSKVLHSWTPLHQQFLSELAEHTRRELRFEDTDYAETLRSLRSHIDWLPDVPELRATTLHALDIVEKRFIGGKVTWSAFHADFTPWNMFEEHGNLFVFDWEYARATYPPMLDRYHFFTQTSIYERHLDASAIIAHIENGNEPWIQPDTYILYLLDMISRFTVREGKRVEGDCSQSFEVWGTLLKHFIEKLINSNNK